MGMRAASSGAVRSVWKKEIKVFHFMGCILYALFISLGLIYLTTLLSSTVFLR